ncbi:hypothetical protein GCM10010422_25840 [Streptomyces graminearus]|uniref:Metallo-beta-lactamase domain-containing protein n=1 Tax=Streptomyces graminearus TaxID=284030 RepID=A0ABN3L9H2_9ACTN
MLGFGGGAQVVHVPGHTDGSIALHLPAEGVLFTGDTVAALPAEGVLRAGEPVPTDPVEHTLIPGVFNLDRPRLLDSVRRLADLGAEVACFGHGDPVLRGAAAELRRAAAM